MARTSKVANVPIEDEECQMLHSWLDRHNIPHEHIPNESRSGKRDAYIRGRKLKSMGVSSGYWDYDIFVPVLDPDRKVAGYELIKIEMKRAKKSLSTVSMEQKNWGKIYAMAGIEGYICYGAEEAKKKISEVYERINQEKLKEEPIDF